MHANPQDQKKTMETAKPRPTVHGLHHVTVVAGDPQENLAFYTGVMGMRLAKKSINQDVEDRGDPEPVRRMKEAIRAADAVLIATPEYQHGLPGVLKNALDWASRPPGDSPMSGKIVGMMGASPSPVGTARAHLQLRETLAYNWCGMVAHPEVLVAHAHEKFDEEGRFTDEQGRTFIRKHLEALAEVVRRAQIEREAV